MSGFKETFTKDDDEGHNILKYDSTASLVFAATLIPVLAIPWSLHVYKKLTCTGSSERIWSRSMHKEKKLIRCECQCSLCRDKRLRIRSESSVMKNLMRPGMIIQVTALTLLWLALVKLIFVIAQTDGEVATFNPYAILGLSEHATTKDIKKAYRTMSLKYHPDRNSDNVDAAAVFMLVTKAYNALTDETARRNYEKYGNPDGPGNLKIGLGLPNWVVKEENQIFVLSLIFIVVLIQIPVMSIAYYNHLKRYTASGIRVETVQFLSFYMHDGTRARLAPEFLAASAEAREIPLRASDEGDLVKLEEEFNQGRNMLVLPVVTKNLYLILAHMRRYTGLSDKLKQDLNVILTASPLVTQSMVELACINNWLQTVQSVLEFRRSLLQAHGPQIGQYMSLLQIPHLTEDMAKLLDKQKIRNLEDLLATENYANVLKEALSDTNISQNQLYDMLAFLKHVPRVDIQARLYVPGEVDLMLNDYARCEVKLTRDNVPVGQAAGAVHCPHFPNEKFEEWFVFISDKDSGHILGYKRVRGTKNIESVEVDFQLTFESGAGNKSLIVFAMCDSYSGVDSFVTVDVKVLPSQEGERTIYIHPDDAALDDESNLLTKYIGELIPKEDSDNSDGDPDMYVTHKGERRPPKEETT